MSSLPRTADRQSHLDAVYRRVCAWKGLVFRHVVRIGHALHGEPADAETDVLRRRLHDLESMLGKLAYARQIPDLAAHRREFEDLRGAQRDVEAKLLGKLGIEPETETTDGAELASLLPQRTAVLDFMLHAPRRSAVQRDGEVTEKARWDPPRVLCWITTHGAERVRLVDLGEAKPGSAR